MQVRGSWRSAGQPCARNSQYYTVHSKMVKRIDLISNGLVPRKKKKISKVEKIQKIGRKKPLEYPKGDEKVKS